MAAARPIFHLHAGAGDPEGDGMTDDESRIVERRARGLCMLFDFAQGRLCMRNPPRTRFRREFEGFWG